MRVRKSARVVLLNDRDEVFLFRHTGKTRVYWVLPGGGVEPGETWEAAALREMREETGIEGVPLGPLLWTRQAPGIVGGEPVIHDERYYLVRCGMPEISTANQLENEQRIYTAGRWWSIAAMRETTESLYPERLGELIAPVLAGQPVTDPIVLPASP